MREISRLLAKDNKSAVIPMLTWAMFDCAFMRQLVSLFWAEAFEPRVELLHTKFEPLQLICYLIPVC